MLKAIKSINKYLPDYINIINDRYHEDFSYKEIMCKEMPKIIKDDIKYFQNAKFNSVIQTVLYNSYNRNYYKTSKSVTIFDQVTNLATALYLWREHKKIYVFDNELVKSLRNQLNYKIESIPIRPLLNMPYQCFCIVTDFSVFKETFTDTERTDGIIVWLDVCMDGENKANMTAEDYEFTPCIHMCFVGTSYGSIGSEIFTFPIYGETLGDSINYFKKIIKRRGRPDLVDILDSFVLIIYMIMYIISINADIKPNELTKKTYKANQKNKNIDRFSQIEAFDVGVTIGNAIRLSNADNSDKSTSKENNQHSKSSAKKPHVRRAHWHHYWVGPKNKPDLRRQIIKWMPPISVNIDKDKEAPIYVTPVK